MRIEQINKNRYVKQPDVVEAYTLKILERFFNQEDIDISNTREDIVVEAIHRMRAELVNGISATIMDEAEKQINDVLYDIVREEILKSIEELRGDIVNIIDPEIEKMDWSVIVPSETTTVVLPTAFDLNQSYDLINVYINGLLNTTHRYINRTDSKYIDKVVFSGSLHPDDLVTIRAVLLSNFTLLMPVRVYDLSTTVAQISHQVWLPITTNIDANKDLVYVWLNGLFHSGHSLLTRQDGNVGAIEFGQELLEAGDIVTVKAIADGGTGVTYVERLEYQETVSSDQTYVTIPVLTNMDLSTDFVDVAINGVLNLAHEFVTDLGSTVLRIVDFSPEQVKTGDIVTVKCLKLL